MEDSTKQQPTNSILGSTLQEHEKNHGNLADVLSELEHRLAPLLRPQEHIAEKPSVSDALSTTPRSDLVAGIDDSNQRLRRYTQRIGVLIERLEI